MKFFFAKTGESLKKNGKVGSTKTNIILGLGAMLSSGIFFLTTSDFTDKPGSIWAWLINNNPLVETHIANSKTGTLIVDLDGQWNFATGDDLARSAENYNDLSWEKINVPANWENDGYANYDGFAWYRRYFNLNSKDLEKTLYVLLGKIDDADEVFINGVKIGSSGRFPPNYVSAWNQNRSYTIPASVVRAGRNAIAVRVYDGQMGGGISRGESGIYALIAPKPLIDLQGDWQFAPGEHPEWKNEIIDGAKASTLLVPLGWDFQGYEDYDGIAWYRKTFPGLELSEEETMILLLGKIDDADEVFLNGEGIGQTGTFNSSGRLNHSSLYRMTRRYEFSSALLQKSNTLAVRVYDATGYGGIYSGPIGIMTKTAYLDHQQQVKKSAKIRFDDFMNWLLGRSN